MFLGLTYQLMRFITDLVLVRTRQVGSVFVEDAADDSRLRFILGTARARVVDAP